MSKAEELAEEMLRLADLSDAGRGPAKSDPRRQAAAELRRLAALEKAIMDAEPVAWQYRKPIVNASGEVVGHSDWSSGEAPTMLWPHRALYTLNGIKKP